MKRTTLLAALAFLPWGCASELRPPVGHGELSSAALPPGQDSIDVHLEQDSAELCAIRDVPSVDDAAVSRLAQCVTADATRNATVVLIGRAPESSSSDVDIGLRRALDVKERLVARGVPRTRILATSSRTRSTSPAQARVDLVLAFPP